MYEGTPEENKESALEDIAQQVDRLEGFIGMTQSPIRLPDHIHVAALKELLPDIQRILKQAYFELGGKDVWSN